MGPNLNHKNKESVMRLYTVLILIAICVMSGTTVAQPSGELIIHATPIENTLDAVIAADQASGTPHAIYTLVSTPPTYSTLIL